MISDLLYFELGSDTFLADAIPTSSDISVRCDSLANEELGKFNITITVGLNESFTPAVLEAISRLDITRRHANARGGIIIEDGTILRLPPTEDIFNQTSISDLADPIIEMGRQYYYVVSYERQFPST